MDGLGAPRINTSVPVLDPLVIAYLFVVGSHEVIFTESIFKLPNTSIIYAGPILGPPLRSTFEFIFSHLVSVESIWNVAPFAITRFPLSNHTPLGDCLESTLISW